MPILARACPDPTRRGKILASNRPIAKCILCRMRRGHKTRARPRGPRGRGKRHIGRVAVSRKYRASRIAPSGKCGTVSAQATAQLCEPHKYRVVSTSVCVHRTAGSSVCAPHSRLVGVCTALPARCGSKCERAHAEPCNSQRSKCSSAHSITWSDGYRQDGSRPSSTSASSGGSSTRRTPTSELTKM